MKAAMPTVKNALSETGFPSHMSAENVLTSRHSGKEMLEAAFQTRKMKPEENLGLETRTKAAEQRTCFF